MKLRWTLPSTLVFSLLSAAQAHSAVVAVMPVQGANLSQGQCDAIGVVFANAFARDSQVAVASPLETKPALAQGQSTLAVAARLGVAEYVELRAIQLGNRVSLAGIIYGKDGREIFRAETSAPGLDDILKARSPSRSWLVSGDSSTTPSPACSTLGARPDIAGAYPWHAAFGDRRGDAGDGTCCRRRQYRTCRTEGKSKGLRYEDGDYLSDGVGSVILSHGFLAVRRPAGKQKPLLGIRRGRSRSYQHEFRYQ